MGGVSPRIAYLKNGDGQGNFQEAKWCREKSLKKKFTLMFRIAANEKARRSKMEGLKGFGNCLAIWCRKSSKIGKSKNHKLVPQSRRDTSVS